MPDDPILSPTKGFDAIASITRSIYQTILVTHQLHPEWLQENFRKHSWHSKDFQSKFTLKLSEEIENAPNTEVLIRRLLKILQTLMKPSFFVSSEFCELLETLRSLLQQTSDIELNKYLTSPPQKFSVNSQISVSTSDKFDLSIKPYKPSLAVSEAGAKSIDIPKDAGIAILLLDAENLHIDEETEDFLKAICKYDIQIKIAFANWQKMGKKDAELHGQHYELIHVPAGKDSADVKMATVGSSIFVHYPNVKEVLVCSSDEAMSHLCTTLQTHGLTVYRVRKHGKIVTVLNSHTGKSQTYSLGSIPQIPPWDRFIIQIKDIIRLEQIRTALQWVELSTISQLFQKKYNLTISEILSAHSPNKNPSEFFLESQGDFVVHQPPDRSQLYVTLFEMPQPKTAENNEVSQPLTVNKATLSRIESADDLERILLTILSELTSQSPSSYITMDVLGSQFSQQYGEGITKVLSRLKLGTKFPYFLQSCSSFKLIQQGKIYHVAIRESRGAIPLASFSSSTDDINSLPDMEQFLFNLLKELTVHSPGSYIALGVLGSEFRKRYGKPINAVIKENLKMSSNLIKLVQYFSSLKLEQTAKGWQVAIALRAR